VTDQIDRRSDSTRSQILRAASRQFAHRPYSHVSLDDILADADVTKGAMYFHFRSKHALASAVIAQRADEAKSAVDEMLARRLSGVETLIDLSFLIAVDDIGDESARAGLNLLEAIGRTDGLQLRVLGDWVAMCTALARKAVEEGDMPVHRDPESVARLVVAMYMGLRQTSDLTVPRRFLDDLRQAWDLLLPGLVEGDRVPYLQQLTKRRAVVATRKATPLEEIARR
jgi:AcrR family transcriptional regulator